MIPRSALWLTLAAVAAGCPTNSASELADGDDDQQPGVAECEVAADCVPAGASCCECPSFALPVASGWDQSCDGVDCADPDFGAGCPRTEAVCSPSFACELRCAAVECTNVCDSFTTDSFGCLTCTCASEPPPTDAECDADADCIRTRADCCGCENGGTDTAVPATDLGTFEDGLGCDPSPMCPGVDTCDPELVPRCLDGTCVLAAAPDPGLAPDAGPGESPTDPAYCGGTYGPCPPGEVCVLNDPDADDASSMGVGVCKTP